MKTFLANFINDESGASAAEYVLILVIIGVGLVAASAALGNAISSGMSAAATKIDTSATALLN